MPVDAPLATSTLSSNEPDDNHRIQSKDDKKSENGEIKL